MRLLFLLPVIFALVIVAYDQEIFADIACDSPKCYAFQQTSNSTAINGIEFDLESPDLWVDRNECDNTAISGGWLRSINNNEWIEAGVKNGDVKNVGCVTLLKTFYGYNTYDPTYFIYSYTEYLVPNGRVDPGDDITVKLQVNPLSSSQVQAFVSTPDLTNTFASAQITLGPGNTYSGSFGIEGTLSAPDEYSSIPMSKFTNMKVKQTSGTWVDLPSTATINTPNTDEGYIAESCSNTSFIAGSVMSLDCNNVAVTNQSPSAQNLSFSPTTNATITININATDTDYDYLQFFVSDLPFSGMQFATAEEAKQAKYDPIVSNYLNVVLNSEGPIVKSKTVGDTKYIEKTTVKEVTKNTYELKTKLTADGELVNKEKVVIVDNQDNTYQIINAKHRINETFTTVEPLTTKGTGNSNLSGAKITLYDSQYGYGSDLEDDYEGCQVGSAYVNYADVWVDIDALNGYSYADCNINPYYNHWCFITHYFDSAEIKHEGKKHNITSSGFGEHTFSHAGGWGTYSVTVNVEYGNW